MKIAFLAATVAIFATALSAEAGITTYTTRAAFDAAAGPTSTEMFNACGGTASLGNDVSLSSAMPGPCGSIQPGVTFSPTTGFDNYIAAAGQSANPTGALGVDFPSDAPMIISFAPLTSAFASDLFQNFGGGTQSGSDATFTLNAFGPGGLLGTFVFPVASGTGGFFGLTSTDLISRIEISQAGGFAVIDNVSFNGVGVPEPAAWALMIGGFGLTGAALRRRRMLAVAS